jgi:hypothetical protein
VQPNQMGMQMGGGKKVKKYKLALDKNFFFWIKTNQIKKEEQKR